MLGTGRHPIAASNAGHAVVYVEDGTSTARIAVAMFDAKGVAQDPSKLVAASAPLAANPVVAALPDGKCVVAYTSIGGDGGNLDIAAVRRASGPKTRAFCINSPANPPC